MSTTFHATRSTGGEGERRFRCRIGLHRWVQIRSLDADLENPGQEVVWQTACRYCGAEHGSGIAFMLGLSAALAAAGVLLSLLVSPVLGVALFIAAVLSLGWAGLAVWLSSYNRTVGFRHRG
jgi:hypothetical protein